MEGAVEEEGLLKNTEGEKGAVVPLVLEVGVGDIGTSSRGTLEGWETEEGVEEDKEEDEEEGIRGESGMKNFESGE